jgi:hypothetical protein
MNGKNLLISVDGRFLARHVSDVPFYENELLSAQLEVIFAAQFGEAGEW